MSQSPKEAGAEAGEEQAQLYQDGWAAISRLSRRGFSWSGHERNCAFLNMGTAGFADVSAVSGFDFEDDGRALALLDWDLDGDLDLLLGNRSGPRVRFLENQSSAKGKTIELLAKGGNAAAIGARLELFLAGQEAPLVRAVRAGEGYLAQSSPRLHFGIGKRSVERARVRWPSGAYEEFVGDFEPAALQLIEGRGVPNSLAPSILIAESKLSKLPLPERTAAVQKTGRRIVLTKPIPMPTLEISSLDNENVNLFGVLPGAKARGSGRPILLNLWASWCAPCIKELRSVKDQSERLEAGQIAWLALSVDQSPDPAAKLMQELGWPYQWGFAPGLSIDVLDAIQAALLDVDSPMPLPSSFLVDAQGMLRVIYLGPLDLDQLLLDERLLKLSDAGMRESSVPFAGTWWGDAEDGGIGLLENKLLRRGLKAAADEYSRAGFEVKQKSRAELLYEFARQSASQGEVPRTLGYLREAVAEDPNFYRAQFELGVLLHQSGELHAAIGAYLGAIAADESQISPHHNLGLAYLGTGQMRSAAQQLVWLEEHDEDLAKSLAQAIKAKELERAQQRPGD